MLEFFQLVQGIEFYGGNTVGSSLLTGIVAVVAGGALATVAALGVVASQSSAGTSETSSSVSYDGS